MQKTIRSRPAQPFRDKIAKKYARKPAADPSAYEDKLSRARSLLHANDRVLEIGCGTGSMVLHLAPSVTHYTAADGSEGMIEIAKSKLNGDTPANVTFYHADASDLIEGHPFDAVCAFSMLHFVEDVLQALDCVQQQPKPGGLSISKTECVTEAPWPIRALLPLLTAYDVAPKITLMSRADLVQHLEDTGSEIEQTRYFGKKRLSPFIVARKIAA